MYGLLFTHNILFLFAFVCFFFLHFLCGMALVLMCECVKIYSQVVDIKLFFHIISVMIDLNIFIRNLGGLSTIERGWKDFLSYDTHANRADFYLLPFTKLPTILWKWSIKCVYLNNSVIDLRKHGTNKYKMVGNDGIQSEAVKKILSSLFLNFLCKYEIGWNIFLCID